MSKGNRTKGPRKGRPPLPDGEGRVSLSTRVKPETLRRLEENAAFFGGIGKAIDAAVAAQGSYAGLG